MDDGGPPWNAKHPGVPKSWTGIGTGGNAIVWSDGQFAIKRLLPNAGQESVDRFAREAELLASLDGADGLAVVPVHEVRRRAEGIEIVMERLDGNLDQVLEVYSGQPMQAARALLPIVEGLARLAAKERPIHHRDIKPSNLLYRKSGNVISLYLSDFGCAYLAGDERLTPTLRAVGAWAYRPPEYSVTRLQEVNEKGDVFSLGKVLWAMINGERGLVFPGPVWYTEEFDLVRKFPQSQRIHHAMLAVAQASDVRPERRPSLNEFAAALQSLANATEVESFSDDRRASFLRSEALIEVAYEQRRAFTSIFVRALHTDLHWAFAQLHASIPTSRLFEAWHHEAQRGSQSAHSLENQVAIHESDAPIVNVRFRQTALSTRFHPAIGHSPVRLVVQVGSESNLARFHSSLTVSGDIAGLTTSWQHAGEPAIHSKQYRPALLLSFLERAAFIVLSGTSPSDQTPGPA